MVAVAPGVGDGPLVAVAVGVRVSVAVGPVGVLVGVCVSVGVALAPPLLEKPGMLVLSSWISSTITFTAFEFVRA